jgi:magnesium-transporting ATPase (P-type)
VGVSTALFHGCAACHTNSTFNGVVLGNEVEVRMFAATGYELTTDAANGNMRVGPMGSDYGSSKSRVSVGPKIGSSQGFREGLEVLRCFQFDQNTRTMSVVVRDLATGGLAVFTKVSPHTLFSHLSLSSVLVLAHPFHCL